VLIIVLAAVSLWGLPGSGSAAPASFGERATADRGSRDDVRATATASPTASPSPTTSPSAKPKPSNSPTVLSSGTCQASYYGSGNRTASGERFDPDALTAAHKTLPFNTRVKVTNPTSGKSVIVRINDRGPFVSGRCLDLTTAAFADIASLSSGVVTVRYEVLK
jgi:rare lipoprotein A